MIKRAIATPHGQKTKYVNLTKTELDEHNDNNIKRELEKTAIKEQEAIQALKDELNVLDTASGAVLIRLNEERELGIEVSQIELDKQMTKLQDIQLLKVDARARLEIVDPTVVEEVIEEVPEDLIEF